ncbi:methyltransferase family protein [Novosphingobium sp. PhB165]|uniref:class I SAM-dependent methyltransferase n=1 Tax=Novosphingobium sp. PhB165 TaxID=2485105 RepID=UPI001051E075|nr:class I SAM-dependent methyltransferase [Novosphingobium sp. PhB165]TCM21948.1 methyltransferase family protein [Novosphingobium sp. PhB165]
MRLPRFISGRTATLALLLAVGACHQKTPDDGRPESVRAFPVADRPVSKASDTDSSTEIQRDSLHEAEVVMDLARIEPGMTVADIGAGEGYYTVRLAKRVGAKGRVLAEDIDHAANERLGTRVIREQLDNVSIKLGQPDNPSLPENSFDRIFLVHVYHEVSEPYAFLWNLRPALRPNGRVIVVEADRASDRHGIPPQLLFCEFGALGFRLTEFVRKPELQGYLAQFEAVGARPEPENIVPCRLSGKTATQNR